MSEFLYDVFICHNSVNKGEVDTIARWLDAKGIRLWYDKFELRPGTDWQRFVAEDWPKIQSIAVFLGGDGTGHGQAFEIRSLLPKAKPRIQFVIPVLLPSFDERRHAIPKSLRHLIHVDFRAPEKKPLELLLWAISGENPNQKESIGTYYRDSDGLTEEDLRLALSQIITRDHRSVSYSPAARQHIADLFEDPENPDQLIEIYTGKPIDKARYMALAGLGDRKAPIWNMDHIWPKAFGFADRAAMIADLHNIVPSEVNSNSRRSAGFFSDPVLDRKGKRMPIPPARHADPRGAIARAALYMAVRYCGRNGEPRLELDEHWPVLGEPHIGSLRTLLYWNRLVEVSAAERRRNHEILRIQGNRNPLVDQPEFATRIWYPV